MRWNKISNRFKSNSGKHINSALQVFSTLTKIKLKIANLQIDQKVQLILTIKNKTKQNRNKPKNKQNKTNQKGKVNADGTKRATYLVHTASQTPQITHIGRSQNSGFVLACLGVPFL